MATAKEKEQEKRKHRTYRIKDTPYLKSLPKAIKLGTTVSEILEDIVILISLGYGADIIESIKYMKGVIAANKKTKAKK